jgi:hypothetical protein
MKREKPAAATADGTVGLTWREEARRLNQAQGLGWREQWLVFLFAASAIAIREPDMLVNPQFYAEGGTWYAEAYNQGWAHALLLTGGGYLQVFPKLVAGLSLLVPLRFAPLLMNLFGIVLQALPVAILLSPRCSRWGPLLVRLLMAAVYLALPNAGEIHVVLTNAQWHLALAACLLALANPPPTWPWRVFDVGVLLLCGLTGPFCLLLFPMTAIFWWKRRQGWSGVLCGLLAVASVLQAAALLRAGWQERVQGPLGATPILLAKIVAGQVYVGALIGQNEFASRADLPAVAVAGLIGTAVLLWCLLKCGWELRLFILFSATLLAAALRSPLAAGPQPQWEFLATSTGGRYWFFPMLAVSWSLIWCATQSAFKPCQIVGVMGLATMLWGEIHDWKYPPFPDEHFPQYAKKLAAAPPGTPVTIPICPEGWNIRLIKKE